MSDRHMIILGAMKGGKMTTQAEIWETHGKQLVDRKYLSYAIFRLRRNGLIVGLPARKDGEAQYEITAAGRRALERGFVGSPHNTPKTPFADRKRAASHPAIVGFSQIGPFAAEKHCFPINPTTSERKAWSERRRLFICTLSDGAARSMSLVFVRRGAALRALMMDAVTGTLYEIRSGACLSSDSLRLVSARRDNAGAMKRLLATRAIR